MVHFRSHFDRDTCQSAPTIHFAPTAAFDDKLNWSKPYATLRRACTAIARKWPMSGDSAMTAAKFYGVKEHAR